MLRVLMECGVGFAKVEEGLMEPKWHEVGKKALDQELEDLDSAPSQSPCVVVRSHLPRAGLRCLLIRGWEATLLTFPQRPLCGFQSIFMIHHPYTRLMR